MSELICEHRIRERLAYFRSDWMMKIVCHWDVVYHYYRTALCKCVFGTEEDRKTKRNFLIKNKDLIISLEICIKTNEKM